MRSATGLDESHKHGQNCMECHNPGGSGEGVFTVAGSIFDADRSTPYPRGTVELDPVLAGTGAAYVLEVDGKGNFYTTDPLDFSQGLYVRFVDDTVKIQMAAKITSGACSTCHGHTVEVISVN